MELVDTFQASFFKCICKAEIFVNTKENENYVKGGQSNTDM